MSDSTLSQAEREQRVRTIVGAARRLADPRDPLGIEARRALPAATGLSGASIELSLSRHLETSVTPADLARLVTRAGSAPRVHVVLSANVFTGVVRAVALAVAAARSVVVRPSSREAVLAPLLLQAVVESRGDAVFEISSVLAPIPGDQIHVYGRRETIAEIVARCPAGVTVRGHGPGFGIAVLAGAIGELRALAAGLSWDIVAFDQRGCLSPRLVFVEGSSGIAERFATCLADELDLREKEVPRGVLSDDERRDASLYRQTLQAVGHCHDGVSSVVGLDREPRAIFLPPPGRHIHLARVGTAGELERLVRPYAGAITCIGVGEESPKVVSLAALVPAARRLPIGNMQCPPLDGPVDLREMP